MQNKSFIKTLNSIQKELKDLKKDANKDKNKSKIIPRTNIFQAASEDDKAYIFSTGGNKIEIKKNIEKTKTENLHDFLRRKKSKKVLMSSISNLDKQSTKRSLKGNCACSTKKCKSSQINKNNIYINLTKNKAEICSFAACRENFEFLSDAVFELNSEAGIDETLSKLQKTISDKYSMEIDAYFETQESIYKSMITEEDVLLESIQKKFENFMKEKAKEELEDCSQEGENEPKSEQGKTEKVEKDENESKKLENCMGLNLKERPFFFVFDTSHAKKTTLINSVPYDCPFPHCERLFFNYANLEKHLEQH